jgi:hypothetical protein
MRTVGDFVQNRTWHAVVDNVVRATGGTAREGVKSESSSLSDGDARSVESWLEGVVTRMKREELAK